MKEKERQKDSATDKREKIDQKKKRKRKNAAF